MYEVLMEIMEPKIKLREDIQRTINVLKGFGHKNSEIKSSIIKEYKLSESEAEEYL